MGIHPFQVSDLNANLFASGLGYRDAAGLSSEFAIVPDNINANASRYMRLMAQWANVAVNGIVIGSPQATRMDNPLGLVITTATRRHIVRMVVTSCAACSSRAQI